MSDSDATASHVPIWDKLTCDTWLKPGESRAYVAHVCMNEPACIEHQAGFFFEIVKSPFVTFSVVFVCCVCVYLCGAESAVGGSVGGALARGSDTKRTCTF